MKKIDTDFTLFLVFSLFNVTIVIIQDVSSEHVAHACSKIRLFLNDI